MSKKRENSSWGTDAWIFWLLFYLFCFVLFFVLFLSFCKIWRRNQNVKIFLMGKTLSLIHFPLPAHLSLSAFQHRLLGWIPALCKHISVQNSGLNTYLSDWFWRRGLALQYHTAGTSYSSSCLLSQQTCSTTSCLQALSCGQQEPWCALVLLRHVPQGLHVQPRHP